MWIVQALQELFIAMEYGEAVLNKIVVVTNLGINIIEARLAHCKNTMFDQKVFIHIQFIRYTRLANINIAIVV